MEVHAHYFVVNTFVYKVLINSSNFEMYLKLNLHMGWQLSLAAKWKVTIRVSLSHFGHKYTHTDKWVYF